MTLIAKGSAPDKGPIIIKTNMTFKRKIEEIMVGNNIGNYRRGALARGYSLHEADEILKVVVSKITKAVMELIGKDDNYKDWIKATRPYGGSREEYDKMEDFMKSRNQLRSELKAKLNE